MYPGPPRPSGPSASPGASGPPEPSLLDLKLPEYFYMPGPPGPPASPASPVPPVPPVPPRPPEPSGHETTRIF